MNGFTTGRLVEPKTKSFFHKIVAKAKVIFRKQNPKRKHNYVWIGINAKRGPWVYTSSQTKLVFENWYPDQPDNEAQDCVHFISSHGKWGDDFCYQKNHYICEFV